MRLTAVSLPDGKMIKCRHRLTIAGVEFRVWEWMDGSMSFRRDDEARIAAAMGSTKLEALRAIDRALDELIWGPEP